MEQLELAEFLERSEEFAAAVHSQPDISLYCSGSVWQWAALRFLHQVPEDSRFLILQEDGNWLVLVEKNDHVFFPFESAWMFGCPFVGHPDKLPYFLASAVELFYGETIGFVLSGIRKDSDLHRSVIDAGKLTFRYEEFPTTDCMTIDLSEGVEAWLERRSRKFRKSARQWREPEDLTFVEYDSEEPAQLMNRIMGIQNRTYKWEEGTDIFLGEEYRRFYYAILEKLHATGELRLCFARMNGEDVAYIFGGTSGSIYRGFQMSYIEEAASYSIGNRLQFENLRRAESEGIQTYDLGMHAPYKERWADQHQQYLGAFLVM